MTKSDSESLAVSKERVANFGEVYTGAREVNAMLDLVNQETERIDSRFLEPACGTGNFLVEILERKLAVVAVRYKKSQLEYERNAVVAVSSIYGIDIIEENVKGCIGRLFGTFYTRYSGLFKRKVKEPCLSTVNTILKLNIVHGDALHMRTVIEPTRPIILPEWSFVGGSRIKRRDYEYRELINEFPSEHDLFTSQAPKSDLGDTVFIPEPIKDYPVVHFLKLSDAQ